MTIGDPQRSKSFPSGGEPSGKVRNVLVVDDEAPVRELLGCYLERLGFHPTLSGGPREALESAQRQHFDLVISDYSMPGLTGIDLYHELERLHPEFGDHFILITGTGFHTEIVKFLSETKALFIEKPFRLSQLEAAIDRIFENGKSKPLPESVEEPASVAK